MDLAETETKEHMSNNTGLLAHVIRGMAEKFVDNISIFNKKRNSVKMNRSGFAKIFHEQIDKIL